jgi:sarcosine oxidase subunit beta
MSSDFDAIIIGAGIIGASIAFELSKRGYKTLNVDKLNAAGAGSTANTCAIIRTHYSTEEGTAMAYESYLHWKDWASYLDAEDERGYAIFHDNGFLILIGENRDTSAILEHHRTLGIPFEEWDIETLKERLPFFDIDSYYPPRRPGDDGFGKPNGKQLTGAIFIPSGGYINDPQLSVHNVQRAAEAKGATFQFNAEVTKIRRADGRVTGITLADGEEIDTPVIINAAGPHSFVINRIAGIEHSMNIKTRAMIISDDDIAGYSRPETGDLLLVGSLDPECDPKEWVEDPDDYYTQVTDDQWRAQVFRYAQRVPSLPIPGQAKGIVDLYDVTDDWIPVYDKTDLGGFYLAIGTSGNQYKNGPMVGILMADLIEACEKGHDHDADPVQVRCPITGKVLNAGFYSRNREINEDSSFSVLG